MKNLRNELNKWSGPIAILGLALAILGLFIGTYAIYLTHQLHNESSEVQDEIFTRVSQIRKEIVGTSDNTITVGINLRYNIIDTHELSNRGIKIA